MKDGKGFWTVVRPDGSLPTPVQMTEDELRGGIARTALNSQWNYHDFADELNRRSRDRQTTVALLISALGLLVAVAAFVVSVLRP